MECGAKKRDGTPCKAKAMSNGKCRIHGGKSLAGAASPTFKTGRHSKYLPTRLKTIYEQSLSDPELSSVRQEIALIDTLISENIEALDPNSNADFWEQALDQIKWARQGYKSENYGMLERALDELEALGDQRRLHYAAYNTLRENIEQRRKLVETDQKIALQGERAITAAELMVFMGAVVKMIENKIPDAKQRNDILGSIDQLMAGNKRTIQ